MAAACAVNHAHAIAVCLACSGSRLTPGTLYVCTGCHGYCFVPGIGRSPGIRVPCNICGADGTVNSG